MADVDATRAALRITCADAVELTTDLLDDALAPGDHERVTEHLAGCRACAVHLDQVRATITVVRRTGVSPPPTSDEVDALTRLFRSHGTG